MWTTTTHTSMMNPLCEALHLFICSLIALTVGNISDEPELIGCEYDPSLQQQRPKHPEQQSQTQARKQALKVHVLQVGVGGSAELHHLETPPQ